MNEAYFKLWAAQAMGMAPWPDERFPPSPYYRFLRVLAQNLHPELAVELGVCGGGGSFHMAKGNPRGVVVGVEKASGSPHERDNWHFIQSHCPNFVFWQGDSIESAPEIAKEYGAVSLLFIDTVHEYDRTLAEWNAWEPFLAPDAVVCLDDLFRPGMEEAWNEVPGEKLRLDVLHDGAEFGGGFGVVWDIPRV